MSTSTRIGGAGYPVGLPVRKMSVSRLPEGETRTWMWGDAYYMTRHNCSKRGIVVYRESYIINEDLTPADRAIAIEAA